MWISLAAISAGLALLVWGADRFVVGAAATARNLGISPMVIGLTIVGFGTSAPEMLVSGVAAWQGNTGIAVGNALGSNIANIALIIGVTALVAPLQVHSATLRREFPMLLGAMVLGYLLLVDLRLDRIDGAALLTAMALVILYTVHLGLRPASGDPMGQEYEAEVPAGISTGRALTWTLIGLLVLLASSRMLVWGAVSIAQALGVSDLVIGLTIVALGTSLPELAASVTGALKQEHDIAIGNIIGSNLFNLLAVLGLSAVIRPASLDPAVLSRDYSTMVGLTLVLMVMAWGLRGHGQVNRIEGGLLLAGYGAYQTLVYFTAVRGMAPLP
jgi:cation:H+ antiporter